MFRELRGKNDSAEVSENLKTDLKNNFVEPSKKLCRTLKLVVRMSKLFTPLLVL